MDDLLGSFKEYITAESLFRQGEILVLAVSGGVDSVVLCELCRQAGYKFIIAHCNFQLRGDESRRDQDFVKALGNKYQTEVLIKAFETGKYAVLNKVSIQEAARRLRYGWFSKLSDDLLVKKGSPVRILTAHHLDDNIETLLLNLFRGTGIAGMRGMLPDNGKIIRPLLFAKKKDLLVFAQNQHLSFVEDSSNLSDKYSRNYFRNQVIPLIQQIYPQVDHNLAENIKRFREVELLYTQAIDIQVRNLVVQKDDEVFIPVLKLLKTVPLNTIVYEIIKRYGFTERQSKELIALLYAQTGKFILSSTHRILRNRKWLIISALQQHPAAIMIIESCDKEIVFEQGKLTLRKKEIVVNERRGMTVASPSIACFDLKQIQFPLVLRKWKQGDYFYPLGMEKKKKLSRFFIDLKMSLLEKQRTWVLEMDEKIIWIVDRRIDNRFKVSANTHSVLEVQFTPINA